jgi:hypothetical protein
MVLRVYAIVHARRRDRVAAHLRRRNARISGKNRPTARTHHQGRSYPCLKCYPSHPNRPPRRSRRRPKSFWRCWSASALKRRNRNREKALAIRGPFCLNSSCPGLSRASTSSRCLRKQVVDGRVKPGHDGRFFTPRSAAPSPDRKSANGPAGPICAPDRRARFWFLPGRARR